ncbi:unnamed protein product, partial [marine sediment metagenome]
MKKLLTVHKIKIAQKNDQKIILFSLMVISFVKTKSFHTMSVFLDFTVEGRHTKFFDCYIIC